jgi:CHAD domain-containing protein
VYLARLAGLRKAGEGELQIGPNCLAEIKAFEARLKKKRKSSAKELTAFLDACGEKLIRLSEEMEAVVGPDIPAESAPAKTSSAGTSALRIFMELASEPIDLDSSNLHAYRKRLKKALYLAELSSNADPDSEQLAAEIRKIHDATGEWHDWQTLAEKAVRSLTIPSPAEARPEGDPDSLIAVLEIKADEALKKALKRCQEASEHLTAKAGAAELMEQTEQPPPRKPVASDPTGRSRGEHKELPVTG